MAGPIKITQEEFNKLTLEQRIEMAARAKVYKAMLKANYEATRQRNASKDQAKNGK